MPVSSSNRSCEFLANSDASTVLKIELSAGFISGFCQRDRGISCAEECRKGTDKFVTVIFLMQR
jgi:hypothetical protein